MDTEVEANSDLESSSIKITNVGLLSRNIGTLYFDDKYSDVTLKIYGRTIRAHRIILATRSEYFSSLLYGGLQESQLDEIELFPDTFIQEK